MRALMAHAVIIVAIGITGVTSCSWEELEEAVERAETEVAKWGGPNWAQVQTGVMRVIRGWYLQTFEDYHSGNSDECEIAAAYVAKYWAQQEYGAEIGKFVVKEMSKDAIVRLISAIWPLGWAPDFARDQVVRWILNRADAYSVETLEVRHHQLTRPANEIRSKGVVLPDSVQQVSDVFLITYDRDAGSVAILVTSDCGGMGSGPRFWEAKYDITEDGLAKEPAEFRSLDLSAMSSVQRWSNRLNVYANLLRDEYAPFSLAP